MIGFNMLGQLGRLGNQMFQVASLRGIASKNNFNYAIPPSKNKNEWTDHQMFMPFTLEGVNPLNIQFIDFDRPQVEEASFSFDEKLFNDCPDWVSLVGFFQSEKYFKHIEDTVHSMFAFRPEILEPCQSMINGVEKPVSLHIRRGDYLTNYKNHHNLGLDYYAKALEHFKDNQIVIFSDDPAWCKQQELFKDDDRFLVSEENNQYMDMCLMSLCVGHIIANSSFSWWGAWLSKSKDVIAPSKWFGPDKQHLETKDLYCEDWTII